MLFYELAKSTIWATLDHYDLCMITRNFLHYWNHHIDFDLFRVCTSIAFFIYFKPEILVAHKKLPVETSSRRLPLMFTTRVVDFSNLQCLLIDDNNRKSSDDLIQHAKIFVSKQSSTSKLLSDISNRDFSIRLMALVRR